MTSAVGSTPGQPNTPDDYFGVCPHCGAAGVWFNLGREHWLVCHAHHVRWSVGSNLTSGWRDEDEATWRANWLRIGPYRIVREHRLHVARFQQPDGY